MFPKLNMQVGTLHLNQKTEDPIHRVDMLNMTLAALKEILKRLVIQIRVQKLRLSQNGK
jgi:hypothetical protein